jgi:hypothetical protein
MTGESHRRSVRRANGLVQTGFSPSSTHGTFWPGELAQCDFSGMRGDDTIVTLANPEKRKLGVAYEELSCIFPGRGKPLLDDSNHRQ